MWGGGLSRKPHPLSVWPARLGGGTQRRFVVIFNSIPYVHSERVMEFHGRMAFGAVAVWPYG